MSGEGAARQIATLQRQVANLARRVTILEKKITEPDPPPPPTQPFFSMPNDGEETGPFKCIDGGQIVRLAGALTTEGSTATTITLYKNGTAVHTVTFTANTDAGADVGTGIDLDDGDMLTAITTFGTGAADAVLRCVLVHGN